MRILGVDPGLNVTGYGVVDAERQSIRLVEAGVVRGGRDKSLAARVGEIHAGIAEVIEATKPEAMAIEELYSHYERVKTSILMGHARGVIVLAGVQAGLPVKHYAATQIKRMLTGAGRATKEQMQLAVQRELGLPSVPEPADVADALAIAMTHWFLEGRGGGERGVGRGEQLGGPPPRLPSPLAPLQMITKITGRLVALEADACTLAAGPYEHEVLIPEFARRTLQPKLGDDVALHTLEYFEGDPTRGKLTPRMVGFLNPVEREFFQMFCQVDGVGVKKALRAMVRPVAELAVLIEEQDAKGLATLPGIGPATGERIIAKLRRKAPKFALLVGAETPGAEIESDLASEVFDILRTLGHSEADARRLIDEAVAKKKKYKDVEALLHAVYEQRQA